MSKESIFDSGFMPYSETDVENDRFYKVPKAFIENDTYREELDNNMRMIYTLLRDRYQLSIRNKHQWRDEEGVIFCLYSRENIAHDLNVSVNTVTKGIKKLVELNLVREIRQGINQPNRLYISPPTLGLAKFVTPDSQNLRGNDTDLKETEIINKRYAISENGVRVLSYYNQRYEETFYKPHPTVTPEQLVRIENQLEMNMMHRGYDEEQVLDMVDAHFENLSPLNDGKVFSFVGTSELVNPMRRYE